MRILRDFEDWPRGRLHLAIGVFDGVHLGHQELIRRLRERAAAEEATSMALSFDPLPIEALAPGAPPSELSTPEERVALLAAAGAESVTLLHFDAHVARTPARDFVARLLAAGDVRRIVVGRDFRFGHDREGDVTLLTVLGAAGGVVVDVMPPISRGGAIVSSTRIRNLLLSGDVRAAADLLGRAYAVRGQIVHGDKRGRALGYPTINVATPRRRLLPRDGIYATWVSVGGERRAAATSLGVRPTFGEGARVLESYILDFSGDVYGQDAETTFVERIRDELRFETAAELVARIAEDVEATRRALAT